MNQLVSIIIPVYNVVEYLDKCIDSVINQTYNNLEIILVDDGSTDGSGEKCDSYMKYDKRIKVFHKSNGGQGSARNIGLKNVQGTVIAFLDSDDYFDSDYIEYLLRLMNTHDADIAICEYRDVNEDGVILKSRGNNKITKEYTNIEATSCALYWKDFGVAPWAKLFKRELWNNEIFDEERIYEDLATTYKILLKAKRIVYESKAKMNYLHRSNSDIRKPFVLEKMDVIATSNEILDFMNVSYPMLVRAAKSRVVASCFFILFQMNEDDCLKNISEVQQMQMMIRKYRLSVVLDRKSRMKTRLGALCSFLGYSFTRYVFNKTRKIK